MSSRTGVDTPSASSTPTSQSRGGERSVSNGTPRRTTCRISICAGVQLQRNVLGSSPLQSAQVSERMAGYLKAALDAVAAPRGDG